MLVKDWPVFGKSSLSGRPVKTQRLSWRVKVAVAIAIVSTMAGAVALNITVTRYIARPAQPTAFIIAIDTYPLEYGGEAYIVRYTLDGAYHAPDFRRHEDVGTFIEHLKTIAAVDGLLDL